MRRTPLLAILLCLTVSLSAQERTEANSQVCSRLEYKKPQHSVNGTMPLNPIQVGITGRIGWKRLYAFVNYSPMNFYKSETNIKGHRLSAGAGIWF